MILNETVRARWVKTYHLSSVYKLCSFNWIRELYKHEQIEKEQNGAALTLTNLFHDDIWPRGYQRMRVKYFSKIFSEQVASALIAHKQLFPEFKDFHATAIFLIKTAKWFKLVVNYDSDKTLSASNFNKFKTFVINFSHLIVKSKFVKTHFLQDFPDNYKLPKSAIKPIQSSIAITSTSLLYLASKMIKNNGSKLYTANLL